MATETRSDEVNLLRFTFLYRAGRRPGVNSMRTEDIQVGKPYYFLNRDDSDSFNPPNQWKIYRIEITEQKGHWFKGEVLGHEYPYCCYNWDLYPSILEATTVWIEACDRHAENIKQFATDLRNGLS